MNCPSCHIPCTRNGHLERLVGEPVGEFQARGIDGPEGIDLYLGLLPDRHDLLLRLGLRGHGGLPRLLGHLLIGCNLVAGNKSGLMYGW